MSDTMEDIKQKMQQQDLSLSQMIKQIDNAILAASQAQQYRIGSRSVQRADIMSLKKLRSELLAEKAQNENHAGFFAQTSVCEFEGR